MTDDLVVNGSNIVMKTIGSGGITKGSSVKLSSGVAVKCTAITDKFFGAALATAASGTKIAIARTGSLVTSNDTCTADAWVEPSVNGGFQDYTSGTKVGICEVAASGASKIRLL